MKSNIVKIMTPKTGVNDDFLILVKLFIKSGEILSEGAEIASLESSKQATTIDSTSSGYFYSFFDEGDSVPVGTVFGIISEISINNLDEIKESFNYDGKTFPESENADIQMTKKAQLLFDNSDLELAQLPKGKILREKDILELIRNNESKRSTNINIDSIKDSITSNSVIICGGGGHAKMCIEIIKQSNEYSILGILDNSKEIGSHILGIPVLGKHNRLNLEFLFNSGLKSAVNGIGAVTNHNSRENLYNELKSIGFYVPNIIHKSASVEPSVVMGEGNQIMANATVGSEAQIGNNCIINSGVVLSHDSKIENNVHLSPGAIIAGQVSIGSNSLIGMGTTIYLSVNIGSNVIIYNGLNVMKNIANDSKVTGNV